MASPHVSLRSLTHALGGSPRAKSPALVEFTEDCTHQTGPTAAEDGQKEQLGESQHRDVPAEQPDPPASQPIPRRVHMSEPCVSGSSPARVVSLSAATQSPRHPSIKTSSRLKHAAPLPAVKQHQQRVSKTDSEGRRCACMFTMVFCMSCSTVTK